MALGRARIWLRRCAGKPESTDSRRRESQIECAGAKQTRLRLHKARKANADRAVPIQFRICGIVAGRYRDINPSRAGGRGHSQRMLAIACLCTMSLLADTLVK